MLPLQEQLILLVLILQQETEQRQQEMEQQQQEQTIQLQEQTIQLQQHLHIGNFLKLVRLRFEQKVVELRLLKELHLKELKLQEMGLLHFELVREPELNYR